MQRRKRRNKTTSPSLFFLSCLEWVCVSIVVVVMFLGLKSGIRMADKASPQLQDVPGLYPLTSTLASEDIISNSALNPPDSNGELADLLEQARAQIQERGKDELLQYVDMAKGLLEEERIKDKDAHRKYLEQEHRLLEDDYDSSLSVVKGDGVRVTSVHMKNNRLPTLPLSDSVDATIAAVLSAESASAAAREAESTAAILAARANADLSRTATLTRDIEEYTPSVDRSEVDKLHESRMEEAMEGYMSKEDDLSTESKLADHGRRFDANSPDHPEEASTSPRSVNDKNRKLRVESRSRNRRKAEADGESPAPSMHVTETGTLANPAFDVNDDRGFGFRRPA
mmetsp:Transcript_80408/g.157194  ORF Transcript_80408/g.157194 Transcript_80408/m.157194 type:complete len:341 (-) Transcript_80408:65-1087(-)